MLTEQKIHALVQKLAGRTDAEKVIVFGSYAKGTAKNSSDLDVLVIAHSQLPIARRVDALLPILQGCLHRVDVHVYTPAEIEAYGSEPFSFVSSVLRAGKVVHERTRAGASG